MSAATLEVTLLRKADGPLTKRISLAPDGSLRSDGSACVMVRGIARRFAFSRAQELAELITHFGADEALTLGSLCPGLPEQVEVVTARRLNGVSRPNLGYVTK
jgi:hypothetical protein